MLVKGMGPIIQKADTRKVGEQSDRSALATIGIGVFHNKDQRCGSTELVPQ